MLDLYVEGTQPDQKEPGRVVARFRLYSVVCGPSTPLNRAGHQDAPAGRLRAGSQVETGRPGPRPGRATQTREDPVRALHHDGRRMVDLPDLTLTDALAIWGAITGSVGATTGTVALVDRLRERPSLVLMSNVTIFGHEHELELTAINRAGGPP
jgi:hypothetical protein